MTIPTIEEILTAFRGIEELEKEATTGPWVRHPIKGYPDDYILTEHPDYAPGNTPEKRWRNYVGETGIAAGSEGHKYTPNAELIVALRNLTPHISEAVKVMTRQREALVEARREGWMRACVFYFDIDAEAPDSAYTEECNKRFPLSGSHDHAE